jgi:molecular chaperone GrpE
MRSADIDRRNGGSRPDGPAPEGGGGPAPGADTPPLDAGEALDDTLARVQAERDEYLDLARRTRAEFENYRKRMTAQQAELRDSAAADLVAEVVVPTLDVLEAGLAHHPEAVEPIYRAVCQLVEGQGLERLDPAGQPFRPEEHEAVVYRNAADPGADGDAEAGADGQVGGDATVSEVLRPGYRWRGRLLRPASVVVTGGRG